MPRIGIKYTTSLRVNEENKVPITSYTWVASTTFKQFYNRKKLKYISTSSLGVAESFKTMSRPNLTVTLFDDLFLRMFQI